MAAAFYDLDRTICSIPTEKAFCNYLYQKQIISKYDVAKVMWGFIKYNLHIIPNYESFRCNIIKSIMKNMNPATLNEALTCAFNTDVRFKIIPEIKKSIIEQQKNNRKIVIISTAIEPIVKIFSEYLNADDYFATQLEVIDNKYSGKVIGPIYYGKQKYLAVLNYCSKNNFLLGNCYAYGDYIEDRYMIQSVGYPYAVNPDKKLLRLAIKNKWNILTC